MPFLFTAWRLHVRQMSTMRAYFMDAVILPVIIATIIVRLDHANGRITNGTSLVAGAAVIGMWSSTLAGAGSAIARFRAFGILEELVAAPVGLVLALEGCALASSTMGCYSMAASLFWAILVLHIAVNLGVIWLFLAGSIVLVLSTSTIGLLLSAGLVRFPRSQSISSAFLYPVWMLTGAVIPIASMPNWLQILSWVDAPGWGVRALQNSISHQVLPGVLNCMMCLLLTGVYLLGAVMLIRRLELLARRDAKLSLI